MNAQCKEHTGTPICQLMVHCLVHDPEKLNDTRLSYFTDNEGKLDGKILVHHVGDAKETDIKYGMLDLPLSMKKIDCAKWLVVKGVDLISGGSSDCERFPVVPMFQEYRDHGTNEFIHWAFSEYIYKHAGVDLKRIVKCIKKMKEKDKDFKWWPSVQRAPAHAILTSQNEKTIKHLVEIAMDEFKLNLLEEESCTGKTALHVAAENGDVESVHILLRL